MKHKEIKNKTREELVNMFKNEKTKLSKLKFELNENKLKDASQIKKTKKDIARIMTALNNFK
ncbi:MAG: 50S ribosomal protein L29 [Candidatus Yanofskybacteria bacterium CG10_big_fil_rev_8_21_14_0_10_37_15]|uniref:Large ribosomal subunit protein uL29 n=1 Tax=Candidatus Yanofskybacteria bacterium CG10_big_fil_rev_8_21_14_0_10_37_15 TaxID=1975097 RepID=A0A2H0R678_9BACT|nr:MAG: 50S ribosomal protein L29 [Candidatus Yanofskybacteria bacterium CG10_big_fil_rev_8_21_14_0_10_37_15]